MDGDVLPDQAPPRPVPSGRTGRTDRAEDPTTVSATLRVGCPMWAHQSWVGRFLSPGRRGEELAEYATWCNAVEGNTTFYAEPSPSTVARWAEQAPRDFRFAFKVPRTITHERRLRDGAHREVASFLRALAPLGERVGPVQIQLPPSFGPESLPALAAFVVGLPTERTWVVELRHPAYFDGGPTHRAVDELFGEVGIGRVVLDTRPLYLSPPGSTASSEERRTKPRLPIAADMVGAAPVVRVIGADDPEVTFGGLTAWLPQITTWLHEGRAPYLFVHQPENLDSPSIARRIHAAASAVIPGLAPLAEPDPVVGAGELAGQASLFDLGRPPTGSRGGPRQR